MVRPGYEPPEQCYTAKETLSPLQLLPFEIRRKIWDEVFPVQVIHLVQIPEDLRGGTWRPYCQWLARVCRVKQLPEEAYTDWTEAATEDPYGPQTRGFHGRHDNCQTYKTSQPRLDIRALRICRNLYEEAHQALYRNTIFALANGKEFGRWIAARTKIQLELIQGLQLHSRDLHLRVASLGRLRRK